MTDHSNILRGMLAVGVLAGLHAFPVLATDSPDKPNVLFIVIDDLRVEPGIDANKFVKTPNIDALAQRGTQFERAYAQQPLCNPSRASLLTGLRPDTLGIWNLKNAMRELAPDVVTLPQLFKRNGYHAQSVGKIFHNWEQDDFKGDPVSWSVPEQLHYGAHGADVALLEPGQNPPDHATAPRTEMRDVPDDAYFDGRVADLAIAALRDVKDKPFFLAVGFWKPHLPFNAPRKYWDLYDRAEIMPPTNPGTPTDVPAIALHDSRELLRAYGERPDGRPTDDDVLALRHGYYAAVSYVDAQVGKVLDELDDLGLRDNTIVVFFSDHGFHLGEHEIWGKASNFELDARVPMIIATPGQARDQHVESLVELLDIYPTLAGLAGLTPPQDLEGVNLGALLDNPATVTDRAAFTQHPRPAFPIGRSDPAVMGYSMRTNEYRYTEWRDFKTGHLLGSELYDQEKDPHETVNIAVDPNRAATLGTLQARMARQVPRQSTQDQPIERHFSKDLVKHAEVDYRVYLPEGYGQSAQAWPLVLWLHGDGGQASRGGWDEILSYGPPSMVRNGRKFPFVLLVPQLWGEVHWDPDTLHALLTETIQKYNIEDDRVALMGYSRGGFGAWELATSYPEAFAAVVAISARPMTAIERVRELGVWIFHGELDTGVPLGGALNMHEELKAMGADVRLTVFPGVGHGAVNPAMATDELWDWLLAQER